MCVVSLLRIQKQILRSLHPHLEPAFNRDARSPNRGKEGGRNEIFRLFHERPPFTAAIIAVFSILTNCFFNHVITTGMHSFYIPLSLIFFYLSTNFFPREEMSPDLSFRLLYPGFICLGLYVSRGL